jgi:hypothetical protein
MFFLHIDYTYTRIHLNCQVEVKESDGLTFSWFRNEVLLIAHSNTTSLSGWNLVENKLNSSFCFESCAMLAPTKSKKKKKTPKNRV